MQWHGQQRKVSTVQDFMMETFGRAVNPAGTVLPELTEDDVEQVSRELCKFKVAIRTSKRGLDLLHDPLLFKGTGYSSAERDRLGVRGLVPPRRFSMAEQAAKVYQRIHDEPDDLRKNMTLMNLYDRNEHLFFYVLLTHIEEFAPYVYTPTVGKVCQKFADRWRRPRGMYFSLYDLGQFGPMAYNWPADDVEVIVVTDGSRILGLGDLGSCGMGIPIGKLCLYVAAGGIKPSKVLPIMLDLGTNREELLADPNYMGVPLHRLTGKAYYAAVAEFMAAVFARWPNVLLQFEDFSSDHAQPLLDMYRNQYLCFNDDIQGTGAVVLGALMSACKVAGIPMADQRVVILGAGSAGIGIAHSLVEGMRRAGLTHADAMERFYILDKDGLLGSGRRGLPSAVQAFVRADLASGLGFEATIEQVRPTMLIGVSASPGAFTERGIREMARHCPRPIIFPLSNPTAKAECTAQQAYEWSDGRCVLASGSPFPAVTIGGEVRQPSQCNNMFIFPGLGLAAVLCQAKCVSDGMLYAASEALANALSAEERAEGRVIPRVGNVRAVSALVAARVIEAAVAEGVAYKPPVLGEGKSLLQWVEENMYTPAYSPLC